MNDGLHWIDGLIIALYACAMVALGCYYSRQQKNTDEYFVGNRSMNPVLIGVSLFATLFSTISYLATPGELIGNGPVVLLGVLSIPLGYYIIGYLIVPVYMRYRVTSAYELLEEKLGLGARLTGATLFVLMRLTWMSLLIYLSSQALLVMLGLDRTWLPLVTFTTGAVAVCYSSLGGLRAVVITDLVQFLLLFGGALLVIATVTMRLGSFDWVPTQWNPTWDTQPLFSWDPTVRVTVVGTLIHGLLWWVCTAGSDQTAIQRFMATKDAAAARRSFFINSVAGAAVSFVLAFVGFALLAYYQADSGRLPPGKTIADDADLLFPYYISHHLPIGLSGLVVSGMFAAAMSSLDSGINSITAVVTTDFVDRFRARPLPDRLRIRTARLIALAIGLAVVSASSFMEYVPGNFLEMAKRTIALAVTPLFTLFFLAVFVPFAKQGATIAGTVAAFLVAALVGYWEPIIKKLSAGFDWIPESWYGAIGVLSSVPKISFQWIMPLSLIAGISVGVLLSLWPRPDSSVRTENGGR